MVQCAGQPALWLPGAVEPLLRTLPSARAERVKVPKPPNVPFLPDWTEDRGQFGVFTDPSSTWIELPMDKPVRDALGEGFFKDQFAAALIFRNMRAWGADLPQDTQVDDDAGMPWAGWPDGRSHKTRVVYAWNIGPAPQYAVTQVMQVQKWYATNPLEEANPISSLRGKGEQWLIFNQWGEDLTFSRGSKDANFSAGFDLGEWISQHQCDLGSAFFNVFNVAYTAICTVVSFGAYGAEAAASLAIGQAFQKALAGAAKAGSTGDWGEMFMGLGQAVAAIGGIPFEGSTLGEKAAAAFIEQNKWVVDNPLVQGVISLMPTGSSKLGELVSQAVATGKQIKQTVEVTEKSFNDLKSQLTRGTDKFYAQLGWNVGKQGGDIVAVRDTVPWYALGQFDMAAVGATLMLVQQGGRPGPVRAARLRHMPPIVGVSSSSTWKWIAGGLVLAGAAALAVRYTSTGRSAWVATKSAAKGATRKITRQSPKMLAIEATGAVGLAVLIYALVKKPTPVMTPETKAMALAPKVPVTDTIALRRF